MSSCFVDEEISKKEVTERRRKGSWLIILGGAQKCSVKCALRIGDCCGDYEGRERGGTIIGCSRRIKERKGKYYYEVYFPYTKKEGKEVWQKNGKHSSI